MGLFLGSLFCFTDSYDCFRSNTMLFWFLITVALCYCLKSGRIMPPALFIFFRIALTILGVFMFHIHFLDRNLFKTGMFCYKGNFKSKIYFNFSIYFLIFKYQKTHTCWKRKSYWKQKYASIEIFTKYESPATVVALQSLNHVWLQSHGW